METGSSGPSLAGKKFKAVVILVIRTEINLLVSHSVTQSLTKTGKYEKRGVSIPVEQRTCLVCKQNCVELRRKVFLDVLPGVYHHTT